MTGENKYERWPRELSLDDSAGPAAHITRAKADAMIASALAEAGFDELLPLPSEQAPNAPVAIATTKKKTRAAFAFWQVAAAALLAFAGIGSASAAVMWWAKRAKDPEPVVTQLASEKPHKKARPKAKVAVVAPAPEEKSVTLLDELTIEGQKKKAEKRAPEDWLDDANRLRAEKRWQEADETYARVWQTAPKSPAAYVARVASAGVRLDHMHDGRGALARYRAALDETPRGALGEEIRFGIAEAYRAMGDADKERQALQAFLHEHPGSGLAKKAKARLSVLVAP